MENKKTKRNSSIKKYNKLFLATAIIIFLVPVVLILFVAMLGYLSYLSDQKDQTKLYNAAKTYCKKEPVFILKTTNTLFGGSESYDLYSPINRDYSAFKTQVPTPLDVLGGSEVYGYYCSMNEAREAYTKSDKNSYNKLKDDAKNYTASEQQSIKNHYLSIKAKEGLKFFTPSKGIEGFKVTKKELNVPDFYYSVGYQRLKPLPNEGSYEQITLDCEPSDHFINPDGYVAGDKVAVNKYGGNIYWDRSYDINYITSVLPTTDCKLTDNTNLKKEVALNYMNSLNEVNQSVIGSYNLFLIEALPNDYRLTN